MKKFFLTLLFGLSTAVSISSCTDDNITDENELYGIDNKEIKERDI